MSELQVRYFAGAAAAAGRDEDRVEVDPAATLDDLCRRLGELRPGLVPVLPVAGLLVDEISVTDRSRTLGSAASVDVLPPFAGG